MSPVFVGLLPSPSDCILLAFSVNKLLHSPVSTDGGQRWFSPTAKFGGACMPYWLDTGRSCWLRLLACCRPRGAGGVLRLGPGVVWGRRVLGSHGIRQPYDQLSRAYRCHLLAMLGLSRWCVPVPWVAVGCRRRPAVGIRWCRGVCACPGRTCMIWHKCGQVSRAFRNHLPCTAGSLPWVRASPGGVLMLGSL